MRRAQKNQHGVYAPFYDPMKSFEENCTQGPFGAFGDLEDVYEDSSALVEFLGLQVRESKFGIPAGPLPRAAFIEAAFRLGFDMPVYKTVRTRVHPTHPWPNVVPVQIEGDLTLEKAASGLVQAPYFKDPIAITNSFGVGCPSPDVWQPDMKRAVEAAGKGQVMIASYQATNRGEGVEAFVADHVLGARLVKETGAKIIEINLSCPNEGHTALLCHDTDMVERVAFAVKEEVGDTPVLLKMAYFPEDGPLLDFFARLGKIVDGFAMINTIAGEVRKPNGEQALPGEKRLRSGVCGAPIKWAGVDMIRRSARLRGELGLDFVLVGTGGVTTPKDYHEYREAGADAVMSATGAMWNPYLAQEIKASVV